MKPRMHHCAAEGCGRLIPKHMLMCIEHWRGIPAPLRRDVNATYRDFVNLGTAASVKAYRAAVDAAVQALASKLERKAAEADAAGGTLFPRTPSTDENPTRPEHDSTEEQHRATLEGRSGAEPHG